VDALKDIARELHMLDMAGARRRQAGHFTSGVGSGVLGGALVAGVVTTGPLLTLGLFAGTVLSSVGGLITFTGREGKRVRELEVQVTAVLLAVEREFEACQQKLQECEGSTEGLEHLRLQVALAESERPGGLQVVARILGNVATFADGLSSRVSSLPREVRSLLDGGLHQVQYFISPYGASALVNLLKGEGVSPTGPVVSANTTSLPENLVTLHIATDLPWPALTLESFHSFVASGELCNLYNAQLSYPLLAGSHGLHPSRLLL